MVIAIRQSAPGTSRYAGLRMSADDYLALADDGFRYELIDGVVVMTPSPAFEHQHVRGAIENQLWNFVEPRKLGWVASEVDVRISSKIVYRPDLVFVAGGRGKSPFRKRAVVPSLVVEVLSPATVSLDLETKKADYAKFGVLEYWVVDPEDGAMLFFRLSRGRYAEVAPVRDRFASKAVPGFSLNLKAIRKICEERPDID